MKIKPPKVFLDSGNPEDTKKAKGLLGHLDGQTTNPSLVAKNPDVVAYLEKGKKLTEKDLLAKYKEIIQEIAKEIAGPISVEVYADWETQAAEMLKQAEDMYTWGNNIYMKFPTVPEGVKAGHQFVKDGGRVNMTLVFTQTQAAAVYAATMSASTPPLLSPFIGRWDDRGYNGLELLKNIIKMYKNFEKTTNKRSHVQILSASIRDLRHLYASIWKGVDIVTIPIGVVREWVTEEKWVPDKHYRYDKLGLKSLVYEDIPFKQNYEDYVIEHKEGDLLDEGMNKFASDWKKLIG
jgi:transaldolase